MDEQTKVWEKRYNTQMDGPNTANCNYYQPEEVFPRVLKKHVPKERIPLVLLQQLALGISLKMIKASSREEVVRLHGEAIQEAKEIALEAGVVHLIDWTTFLLM